jgi:hypothetical protein
METGCFCIVRGEMLQARVKVGVSNDVSTEAEESPLLRSVTRKRLVKAD